ncbi:MAG: hypothetical protein ABIJ56_02820, partial [Pseudomonadota bacterium]
RDQAEAPQGGRLFLTQAYLMYVEEKNGRPTQCRPAWAGRSRKMAKLQLMAGREKKRRLSFSSGAF